MNSHITQALDQTPTGDILNYFNLNDDILQANSGVHDNKCLSMDSSDTQCPVQQGMFTKLKLTDESIHITNIDKSSITALVKIVIKATENFWSSMAASDSAFPDVCSIRDKITRWFVGLKSSSQLVDAYRVYSKNRKTTCEQATAIHENAAIRMLKAQEELDCKPGIYTLWENAFNMSKNICGTYFSLADLRAAPSTGLELEFEITIPIDDLLPFSGMKMFPNCIFGSLTLELKMAIQQNFVICQCNTMAVIDKILKSGGGGQILHGLADSIKDKLLSVEGYEKELKYGYYTNNFTQIGDPFYSRILYILSTTVGSWQDFKTTFVITGGTLKRCCSNINGFNIKNEVIEELERKYYKENNAMIIPAQYVENLTFSQGPLSSGLKCNATTPMTNVSSVMFLFPRTPNELTCSRNPLLSSLQCLIENRPFPDKPFSSIEQSHAIFNITNAGLDGIFSPNKEFVNSIIENELEVYSGDTNTFYYSQYDNSSYCFLCSTERLSGYGTFCDGINKENAHVNLNGTLLPYTTLHPYLKSPVTLENNTRFPIMLLCQDCFWECSVEKGCKFVCNDKSFVKETTGTD